MASLDTNGTTHTNGHKQDPARDATQDIAHANNSSTDIEKNGVNGKHPISDREDSPKKRIKSQNGTEPAGESQPGRQKGVAPIKKEYLVQITTGPKSTAPEIDDDAAEAGGTHGSLQPTAGSGGVKTKRGQNKARDFGSSRDALQLCNTRARTNEFSPKECRFGDKCRLEHDLRKYLREGKREDLKEVSGGDNPDSAFAGETAKQVLGGVCPIWEERGTCSAGWKCRFVSSHSAEVERDDGRRELTLIDKPWYDPSSAGDEPGAYEGEGNHNVVNVVSNANRILLERNKWRPLTKSETYSKYLEQEEHRASYTEPPFRASEKRRIYYGPETPVLAPLTTQGNLPFRRLCVSLGAQVTWSEMVRGHELIRGEKRDWPLVKAHADELTPPSHFPPSPIPGYAHDSDIRFGVQLAANKPLLALKATEVLTELCPRLRAIDLNCGCPTGDVTKVGAGAALLGKPGRIENILRGMNAVSGEVPITVKIRMGVETGKPTADKLCQRLVLGGADLKTENEGPPGVAAITLHGRSQQQRYTKSADWGYIASCATLIKGLRERHAELVDTVREREGRDLANSAATVGGMPYFCGNGDVLSHVDYNAHLEGAGVDAVMIGRGALVKPWVFEEIEKNQYLDKSASERLGYIEKFVRDGLSYWGSDEFGVGTTRKFLLEWLSFSCRYVPIGLLEYLPPKLGDRPPAFRGRNELETLLASGNYKDWIKISEWFLGPAHKDFVFQPKHKSNSYEIETNG